MAKRRGYPDFSGGFTNAPFDVIGDTLRGTRGIMLDMYRHPDEPIEACERIIPFIGKQFELGNYFLPEYSTTNWRQQCSGRSAPDTAGSNSPNKYSKSCGPH